MTVASLIAWARGREADLASSTVAVTRASTTPGTFDPDTAQTTPTAPSSVYSGAALVHPTVDQIVTAGEASVDVSDFTVKLPADTPVELGDIITVTGSMFDAGFVGMSLRVIEVANDEWQVCRKCLSVVQTVRPI